MVPLAAGQMPSKVRARDVLPAPLGPMIASASPDLRLKWIFATIGVAPPGAMTMTCSASRLRAGFGKAVAADLGCARTSASDSRVMLWRAATKVRQFAIAV